VFVFARQKGVFVEQIQIAFPDSRFDLIPSNSKGMTLLSFPCPLEAPAWFCALDVKFSSSKSASKSFLEVTMESIKKETVKLKTHNFPTVSLFLKWYLCRTTLEKNKKIKKLLDEMNGGNVSDPERWISLLRLRILGDGYQALCDILERQLNPNEVIHLCERTEEFIQLYAMGSNPE
jgi:hypothetical protein